jgi:hypothetical protein
MNTLSLLWAYLGPETTLPLASVLGAVVGALLIGWNWITGFLKKIVLLPFRVWNKEKATAAQHAAPLLRSPSETTIPVSNQRTDGVDDASV